MSRVLCEKCRVKPATHAALPEGEYFQAFSCDECCTNSECQRLPVKRNEPIIIESRYVGAFSGERFYPQYDILEDAGSSRERWEIEATLRDLDEAYARLKIDRAGIFKWNRLVRRWAIKHGRSLERVQGALHQRCRIF